MIGLACVCFSGWVSAWIDECVGDCVGAWVCLAFRLRTKAMDFMSSEGDSIDFSSCQKFNSRYSVVKVRIKEANTKR